MMKLLANLPDNVVGITASGEVDAKDYETVLMPAIESALKKRDRIRVLYQLTPEFSGFTPGAMWDDAKLGVSHWKSFEKVAVVTDVHWIAHAIRMFAFAWPAPIRVFSNKEQPDAGKWIAA